MSQQGPILVVSTARRPSFAATLDIGRLFPVVETEWADAVRAVEQMQPAAVRAAECQPYLPVISIDPDAPIPDHFIPFFSSQGGSDRLAARLRAALRVR